MTKWPSCLFPSMWKHLRAPSSPPRGISLASLPLLVGCEVPSKHRSFKKAPTDLLIPRPECGNYLTDILWKWATNCLKGRFRPQGATYTFKNVLLYIQPLSWTVQFNTVWIFRVLVLPLAKRDVIYGEISTPLWYSVCIMTHLALHPLIFSEVTMEAHCCKWNQHLITNSYHTRS